MSKVIKLTQGKFAIVDELDYDFINQYKWYALKDGNTFYARRNVRTNLGMQTVQQMHTLITGYKRTDHINGNGLDNQRENLREATNKQNAANTKKINKKCVSKYKGVTLDKGKYWKATIRVDGVKIHIGMFKTEMEAAIGYDCAAVKHFGSFAKTNFPIIS